MNIRSLLENPYLKLMRLPNSFATVFAVIVGALVAGVNIFVLPVFFVCIIAFLIVAGGFVINDYYDIKIDIANKRDRPIPLGQIQPDTVKTFGYSLLTAGILLAIFTLPPFAVLVAGTSAFLLDLYSRVLKPKYTLIGNFVTSYSTAITYVFGWSCLLSVISEKIVLTLFWMFVISLSACLGREFIKSIQDKKGDSKSGVNNIAVRYGVRNAAILATVTVLIATIFSPMPYILGLFGLSYLILIIVVDVSTLLLCILLIRKIREVGEGEILYDYARRIKKRFLVTMALGIFAFFMGMIV